MFRKDEENNLILHKDDHVEKNVTGPDAIKELKDKKNGSLIIRKSSNYPGFVVISVKVPNDAKAKDNVEHHLYKADGNSYVRYTAEPGKQPVRIDNIPEINNQSLKERYEGQKEGYGFGLAYRDVEFYQKVTVKTAESRVNSGKTNTMIAYPIRDNKNETFGIFIKTKGIDGKDVVSEHYAKKEKNGYSLISQAPNGEWDLVSHVNSFTDLRNDLMAASQQKHTISRK